MQRLFQSKMPLHTQRHFFNGAETFAKYSVLRLWLNVYISARLDIKNSRTFPVGKSAVLWCATKYYCR